MIDDKTYRIQKGSTRRPPIGHNVLQLIPEVERAFQSDRWTMTRTKKPPPFRQLSSKDNATKRESQPLSTTREPTNNGGGQCRRSMTTNFVAVAFSIQSPRFSRSQRSPMFPLISTTPFKPRFRSTRRRELGSSSFSTLAFQPFAYDRPYDRWSIVNVRQYP